MKNGRPARVEIPAPPAAPAEPPALDRRRGRSLLRMKFAHKVALLPGLAAAGFLVILAISLFVGQRNRILLGEIQNDYFPAFQASDDLEDMLQRIQRNLQDAVASREPAMLDETDSVKDEFIQTLNQMGATETIDVDQILAVQEKFLAYYDLARRNSQELIAGEPTDEGRVRSLEEQRVQLTAVGSALQALSAETDAKMKGAFTSAQGNQDLSILVTTVVTAFSVVALAVLSFFLIRSLTKPLAESVDAARRLALGDMTVEISPRSRDEVGELSLAMARMIEYLREMAGVADSIAAGDLRVEVQARSEADMFGNAFHRMSSNLRLMIGDVKQSAAQVAATADEISASALQIKRGAESQSSSTEETSATMVEMATQIDSINRSTQALAANVEETSSSIEEMGISIEEVAHSSEDLLTSVEETSSTIEEMIASTRSIAGRVQVVDEVSRDAARAAADGGGRLSQVILGIGASTKDIGKIVRMIGEFADQT
ncbi:MAG TPA: methyl-accepting chemotaxis protein, partial [Thermoanaerobaculia bacterium]|nr:methyl-accepting chemotaxis protein [Thermoanaerobaculia bacterium]